MSKRLLLPIILGTSLQLAAQAKYTEGSVVTSAGDTLKGYIEYRGWYQNPESVLFKKSPEASDVVKFTALNTRWFSMAGHPSYAAAVVSISLNRLEFASLGVELDTTKLIKAVFLKEVYRGERLTLYSFQDHIKERFYISNDQQTPVELIFGKTVRELQEYIHDPYKQQLKTIAIQHNVFNADFEQKIQLSDFSKHDLVRIVQHISRNKDQAPTMRRGGSTRVGYQVSVGINYNRLTYTGKSLVTIDGLNDAGFDKYKDEVRTERSFPLLSAGVDIYTNPITRKLVIRSELSATKIESTTTSYSQYNYISPAGTENTYRLSGLSVSLTPQLLYHLYSNRGVSCFVGVGASLTFLRFDENTAEQKRINQAATGVFVQEDYLFLKSSNLSAVLRAGIQLYRRFEGAVSWSNPTKYTTANSSGQSLKAGSFIVSVGYLMNRSPK